LKKRIADIVRVSKERGKGNVNGISVYTKMPTDSKLVEEVRSYGEKAVPILADYLESKNQQERLIAVNFLGNIGGAGVVSALAKVINGDSPSTTRIVALRWLGSIDDPKARAIVFEVAETETTDALREEAL